MKRVDNFEKGEPVEIGIPGADLPDSVFTHEDGCVSVVQEIASQVRNFTDNLARDLGVSLGWDEQIKAGRGEQRCDEPPCLCQAPGRARCVSSQPRQAA